jgi:hypothetical protein
VVRFCEFLTHYRVSCGLFYPKVGKKGDIKMCIGMTITLDVDKKEQLEWAEMRARAIRCA